MTTGRPTASSEGVRRRLSRQRAKDTRPELALRRELFRRGLRYRVNYPVPGRPRRTIDVAFPRQKLAVFVDGCFWHSCPDHSVPAKSNADWWRDKLTANMRRDKETTDALVAEGWQVIRLWEHEVHPEPGAALNLVLSALATSTGRSAHV